MLSQAAGMLGFLFVPEAEFTVDDQAAASVLTPAAEPALRAASGALAGLQEWSAAGIEAALRAALVDGLGLKPKLAFGPVRVAARVAGCRPRCSSPWRSSAVTARCRGGRAAAGRYG